MQLLRTGRAGDRLSDQTVRGTKQPPSGMGRLPRVSAHVARPVCRNKRIVRRLWGPVLKLGKLSCLQRWANGAVSCQQQPEWKSRTWTSAGHFQPSVQFGGRPFVRAPPTVRLWRSWRQMFSERPLTTRRGGQIVDLSPRSGLISMHWWPLSPRYHACGYE